MRIIFGRVSKYVAKKSFAEKKILYLERFWQVGRPLLTIRLFFSSPNKIWPTEAKDIWCLQRWMKEDNCKIHFKSFKFFNSGKTSDMQNLSGTCFKTIVGIMLNDVVKYKKLMCSFMSLTGLAYNTVIECSAKKKYTWRRGDWSMQGLFSVC